MDGSFEPELIKKGQTRIDGMDDKIIHCPAGACKACCREGASMLPDLSTRDIRAQLEEVYGLKVSADLISRVTDAVLEEVSDWQNRALEPMYPVVFLDALRVKICDAPSRDIATQYPVPLPGSTCKACARGGNGKPSGQKQSGLCGPGGHS